MKNYYFLLLLFIFSCSKEEDKTITTVLEQVGRGAALRTVEIRNAEFDINDTNSQFNVLLEEQDIEDGNLLESVEIRLSFIDNSMENGDQSILPVSFDNKLKSDFSSSSGQFPEIDLIYSFQELLDALDLQLGDMSCKDQFRLDLYLNLSNATIFSTLNSSGTVVNNSGFFKSPFSYLVNIVEPIDTGRFTGIYEMETLEVGVEGLPLGTPSGLFEITQGHSNNVRILKAINEGSEELEIEMTIACDIATVTRYQKTLLPTCASFFDPSNRVLLGPAVPPGQADSLDDTVFELNIFEGFEGYSVECGYTDILSRYRFSKQ